MAYSYLTFLQARQALASKLADEGNVRWSDQENKVYIWEALQTWNCLTAWNKQDWVFNVNPGAPVTWINPGQNVSGFPISPRVRTANVLSVYTIMQYHLQQPPTGFTWTGTTQFQTSDLTGALNRYRSEIQQQTACNCSLITFPAVSINRVFTLPDNVLEVVRARWVPRDVSDSPPVTLVRDDRIGEMYYEPSYLQDPPGHPSEYDVSSVAPLQFVVDVPPNVPGNFELIVIQTTPDFAAYPLLGMPDDFAWVLKNGAMAEILGRESEATDRPRAAYFQKRYLDGLKLMQVTPWIQTVLIDNVTAEISSVVEMDGYSPEWDSKPATLFDVITTGIDFFTFVPDTVGPTSISMSVLGNAVLPDGDGDFIQVSRDTWEAILDYAQFLATIKLGGAEFQAALPLEANFIRLASMTNGRLIKNGIFLDVLYKQGTRQQDYQERFSKDTQES